MRFVRAACHVHSNWSYDGSWSPADLARAFRRRRYDVVLMAEHDRGFSQDRWSDYQEACLSVSDDRLLLVPGIEYSDPENCVHIAVWGELPFLGEHLQPAELLGRVSEHEGVAIFAHPGRREAWRRIDPKLLVSLAGIELWNRKYDGWAPSRHAAALLSRTSDCLTFVGNDFHTRRQFFPLAMMLEVDGDLTVEAVYAALRLRRCRPRAFRFPPARAVDGAPAVALRSAEKMRRRAARRLRAR
jgi:hypothetical protein